ncbi:MAG: hypothetical protein ABJO30_11855 [Hyphomicrobiales bacterium]
MALAQYNDLENYTNNQAVAEALTAINVNISTGFGTNYLNHFVEILLLLEMLPSMPECIEDIVLWKPISYSDHVRQSGLPKSELVLEAFQHSDAKRRDMLDHVTNEVNTEVHRYIEKAQKAVTLGDQEQISEVALEAKEVLTPMLEKISNVICSPNFLAEEPVEDFA